MKIRTLLLCTLAALAMASLAVADGPGLQTLEMGTGPTVVMVPDLGGSRTDWLQTVKRLRDHYHCVMVDIPGQGTSPLPDPFSLQAAAEQVAAVVAKQKAESTVIVGIGLGGALGLRAAGAHPDHQRGVMLIDTQIKLPFPVAISDQQRDKFFEFMETNYDQFSRMLFARRGRDSVESEQLYALIAAVPPATVKAYFRSLFTADGNRDFASLKPAPAVVLTEEIWKAGTSAGTIMKSLGIDDTTLATPVRMAPAGRRPMKEQPDSLAALVTEFANRSFAAPK